MSGGNRSDDGIGRKLTTGASRRTFLKGTGAAVVTGGLAADGADAASGGSRVIGYYPSYAGSYMPSDVPFEKLTHLNYAFLDVASDGTVSVGSSSDADLLRELATYDDTDTVFMLSISAGWYSGKFSDAASTATRRQRFAKTAIDIMEQYQFDGLDLDWEYPDGSIRSSDPHNFSLLLKACRDELDARFGSWTHLSIAGSPNPSIIDDAYEVSTISNYLDHINVMTYDYHGSWSSETNFNAPFLAAHSSSTFDTKHHMRYWAGKPIAKDKLVMGMPFYGRSYSGVASDNNGLFNSFDSSTSITYYDIQQNIEPQSDYQYYWHSRAQVPWLYSATENTFISYDDSASIGNKSDFVKNNNYGGTMCWELSQDSSNTLVTTMHDRMNP